MDQMLSKSCQKIEMKKRKKKLKNPISSKNTSISDGADSDTDRSPKRGKIPQFSSLENEMIDRKKKKRRKYEIEEDEYDESSEEDDKDDTVEDQSEEESSEEEVDKEEYEAMRKEIANMPFEDLIKLKERIGTKAYNKAMHGDKHPGMKRKQKFKRKNKNRPMEISSKKRVPAIREVIPVKKKINRDPRFDDLSGEFREDLFNKSYSFLKDIRVRERERVQKQLKRMKNTEKKQDLHYLLNRMKQQEMATDQKQKRQDLEKKWKTKEKERVKEGKNPFYLKKGDLKKLELAEKYRELKKSGKVDNYLSKKRKKTASKEKKKLPLPAKHFGFT
ncbi:ribosomal RNA processing protein 36 homolog [Argopecten irradians]|uniref:ribosomal RNA processing protein 36 homolog n=1 Tax=Argopecten irradians TaxID=31199 RepID=UPI00372473E7